jgi:pyrimidine deaminase RibD-like protein
VGGLSIAAVDARLHACSTKSNPCLGVLIVHASDLVVHTEAVQ